ncbi:MAG TPA: hypothetical protein VNF68_04700 [Candidatus Baltobacteraceae bacterium]|nr:hypothetical protein [Candidatus Baltobacteraceae bacterium]
MDVQSIASGLAASSVSTGVDIGVLRAVDNLAAVQAATLFASIGLGTGVNTYA